VKQQKKGYLEQYGYEEGHAIWKFHFPGKVVYRNKNRHALQLYYKERDWQQFDIYTRNSAGGWKLVAHNRPSKTCQCGRYYDDNPYGEMFKYQSTAFTSSTIEGMTQIMLSPVLCMLCYYKLEYDAGRFCPKLVKQELGLDS
jgi:hypothetical protein